MEKIQLKMDLACAELESFKGGRKSSAATARRHLLDLTKECGDLRKLILAESKEAKAKATEAKLKVTEEKQIEIVPAV